MTPDAAIAGLFRAALTAERVVEDERARRLAASDIGADATVLPACVLKPCNEDEIVALVTIARREGIALHPHGGGWSYTGAYAPQVARSAIVDMSGLGGITIGADGTVTAGAGVTWSALDQ